MQFPAQVIEYKEHLLLRLQRKLHGRKKQGWTSSVFCYLLKSNQIKVENQNHDILSVALTEI